MRRSHILREAAYLMGLPYNYTIVDVPAEKVNARRQLGIAASSIMWQMAEEFKNAALDTYIRIGITERTSGQVAESSPSSYEGSKEEGQDINDSIRNAGNSG